MTSNSSNIFYEHLHQPTTDIDPHNMFLSRLPVMRRCSRQLYFRYENVNIKNSKSVLLQALPGCLFSSSSANIQDTNTKTEVVLYKRPTKRNITILKSSFVTATFHTGYWIWYIVDFIPVVNASPMPQLHVDPLIGWTGFIFALAIQAMVMVYPKRLVSQLSLQYPSKGSNKNADPRILLYTYSWWLLRPASRPTSFQIGQLTLDDSKLNNEQQTTQSRRKQQQQQPIIPFSTKSQLGLKSYNSAIPFLVDVKHDGDLLEPELLWQVLLVSDSVIDNTADEPKATPLASTSNKVVLASRPQKSRSRRARR